MAKQNQTIKLAEKVMRHMQAMHNGSQVGSILLTGDPGIGKTTMVALLAALLGMKAIIIEIPHITEEHLINIPFLVFDSGSGTQKHGSTSVDTSKMTMKLADSNLFSALQSVKAMSDPEYLAYIQKAPLHVQQVYTAMGGTATQIPEEIVEARAHHRTILFLDEFYRQSSMRIRNIMRDILNGNIGMHRIPKDVYIMYASNMRDSGLEGEIPSNHQFNAIEYEPPKKDDWFMYMAAKYENHEHVKLNAAVMKKFQKILKDEDISYDDVAVNVRTSPRRWEQLISYINTSLPVHSNQEARALLTNIKNNFIHYQDETHSDLAPKVTKALAELIKETSQIDVDEKDTLQDHEWRDALDHAVLQAIRAGGSRKHIPVVSGPPGIGKTSNAWQVAENHNLRLIPIDVSSLFADDVVGMPLPGERTEKHIKVKFSAPKLHRQITDMIEHADQVHIEELMQEDGAQAKQKIEAYKKQKFKYLILFDELNRVDAKTFNSLRRVILERNFGGEDEKGEEYTIPEDAIVIGAINPHGAGTEELTSHFRDVIDVIPAKASWSASKKHIREEGEKKMAAHSKPEVRTVAEQVMHMFAEKFADKKPDSVHGKEQQAFNLDINGFPIYISPREYTDMYATLTREMNARYKKLLKDPDMDAQGMRPEMDDTLFDALRESLNMVFNKQNPEMMPEFMQSLKSWIHGLPDSVYGGLLNKTAAGIASLSGTLSKYLEGHALEQMPEDEGIVSSNDAINHAQFMDGVRDALTMKIVDAASLDKFILDKTHQKVELKGKKIVQSGEETSLLENFFLSLLYTLHLHQYAHDRLASTGKALSTMMSVVRKDLLSSGKIDADKADEASEAVAELRSDLLTVTGAL